MTNNLDSPRGPRGTIATIAVTIIAYGVLMAIRSEFEQPWAKTAIAACAGAFLGVALYHSKKFWPRAK
jgi:cobalamin synthase